MKPEDYVTIDMVFQFKAEFVDFAPRYINEIVMERHVMLLN